MIGYKFLGCGICNLLCCSLLEDDEREDGGDRVFRQLVECAEAKLLQCQVSTNNAIIIIFMCLSLSKQHPPFTGK